MSKLNDLTHIETLDKSRMDHKIIHMPENIYITYTEPVIHNPTSFAKSDLSKIKNIVIFGMGGSAISADIAQSLFQSKIPISVVKDYHLPYIDESTLCIALSYSGNTEETVTCLQKALKSTSYIAAVTSGGKVKEIVDTKFLWLEIPSGLPPRSAIGHLFFALIKILEIFEIIHSHSEEAKSVTANLMQKAGSLCLKTETNYNLAKSSAETIFNKIPIIYSSNPRLNPIAYRWKCQINENAKYPAFSHTFPEMNHNEIEAWENSNLSKNFIPIFLRFFEEEKQYSKRIEAFKKLLDKDNITYLEFYGDGNNDFSRMFSLIYLGDMISYYIGILNNIDPTEIKYIDFLKNEISK
jgi:glucose/mannose-6-phosphate isomerase